MASSLSQVSLSDWKRKNFLLYFWLLSLCTSSSSPQKKLGREFSFSCKKKTKQKKHEKQIVWQIYFYNFICFIHWQSSTEALIAATSYLDLFLRSITDANLMKVFLEFIMVERCDGTPILDLLVSRIAHESQVNSHGREFTNRQKFCILGLSWTYNRRQTEVFGKVVKYSLLQWV